MPISFIKTKLFLHKNFDFRYAVTTLSNITLCNQTQYCLIFFIQYSIKQRSLGMKEKEFIKLSKKKSLEIVKNKNEANKYFVEYLTHVRVFLNSFYLHKKQNLSVEDYIEFGITDDVAEAFDSFSRYDQRSFFLYYIVNFAFSDILEELRESAYDEALKIFHKTCVYPDKEDNYGYFLHSKKKILKEYDVKLDEEEFFNLYAIIAEKWSLTKNELRIIHKNLNTKYDDLLVLDPSGLMKSYSVEIKKFAGEK